ncbi:calpain-2 catalytic subunit-like [Dendropsophus ebraccatus]|uniref:calpain-2 catalytic subunit-like n=1 Tax=Dendropsophus ebraccatus TaxID=150705 RepID=UPI0038320F98
MAGVASKVGQEQVSAVCLGSIDNPVKFAGQDFKKLKEECLKSGKLFEDPKFPAAQSSLGKDKLGPWSKEAKGLVWKRPKEIKKNPAFIVTGAERGDVCQGRLGDCWFLSSIASLSMNKDCLFRVVPQDQSFDKDYAGIFHFLFWQYGKWVDVVIDDRLPTKENKLLFVKSETSNEFWTALLEKAYAKIHRSYEALIGGYMAESLADFTGGVCVKYKSQSAPNDYFQIIQRTLRDKCLAGCTSIRDAGDESIVGGHAYTITGAEEVTYNGAKVQLIRARNPWGFKEWKGAWSDNSEEWKKVNEEDKKKLKYNPDDGEFWIAFPDFQKQFPKVQICDITLSEVCCSDNYKYCLTEFNGSWKKGETAGGRYMSDTFWMNPQFRVTLTAPDGDTSKKSPITVSLMQKEYRKNKFRIGFYIFKVNPEDTVPLGKEFFDTSEPVVRKDDFRDYRDVSGRFVLLPGKYVIVVTTLNPFEETDFYLRVFFEIAPGAQSA